MKPLTCSIVVLLHSLAFCASPDVSRPAATVPVEAAIADPTNLTKPRKPKVQLALLLDTSGSMEGLINQAKTQLWSIVNQFITAKRDGQTPDVEVALYEYGNDGLPRDKGFVRCISPFSMDLDTLSEALFALKTNGGSEYCGWAIRDASRDLAWDASKDTYKAIFIAGNEPFSQGEISYRDACKKAISAGVLVNTIHCASPGSRDEAGWRDGAALADGQFFTIDSNQTLANVVAPQDKEIATINSKLNDTYVAYGDRAKESKERQVAQDSNALSAPGAPTVIANRARSKASAAYKNSDWDLIDATKDKKFDLTSVPEDKLPEELKKLPAEKRSAYLEEKSKEREAAQADLRRLVTERETWVKDQLKQKAGSDTLGDAVANAVRKQAASKGITFEEKALKK